jgi:hypothetical protein
MEIGTGIILLADGIKTTPVAETGIEIILLVDPTALGE